MTLRYSIALPCNGLSVEKWLLHQWIEWISRINAQMEWICGSNVEVNEEVNEYK